MFKRAIEICFIRCSRKLFKSSSNWPFSRTLSSPRSIFASSCSTLDRRHNSPSFVDINNVSHQQRTSEHAFFDSSSRLSSLFSTSVLVRVVFNIAAHYYLFGNTLTRLKTRLTNKVVDLEDRQQDSQNDRQHDPTHKYDDQRLQYTK